MNLILLLPPLSQVSLLNLDWILDLHSVAPDHLALHYLAALDIHSVALDHLALHYLAALDYHFAVFVGFLG